MSGELEREVYRSLRASQEKYTYFMLTAAGAAIAFATTQTRDAGLDWIQLPLGLAILSWGASFFAGCMNLQYVNANLYANFDLLRVQTGAYPLAGSNPQQMAYGEAYIKKSMERNDRRVRRYAFVQFAALIAGAVGYVAWHIIQIYLRTGNIASGQP